MNKKVSKRKTQIWDEENIISQENALKSWKVKDQKWKEISIPEEKPRLSNS